MQNLDYNHYAQQAAALERKQQYEQAAKHWQKAFIYANKDVNSTWGHNRAKFCRRMAVNPF